MQIFLSSKQKDWLKAYLECQKTYHLKGVGTDALLLAEACLNSSILEALPPYHLVPEPSEAVDFAPVPAKIKFATQKQAKAEVGKILKEMRRDYQCSRRARVLWLAQGLKWNNSVKKYALRSEYLNLVSMTESNIDSKLVHYVCNQCLTLSQAFDQIRERSRNSQEDLILRFKYYNKVT